jgi:beta-galactosidase beta subunit
MSKGSTPKNDVQKELYDREKNITYGKKIALESDLAIDRSQCLLFHSRKRV